jgi:hypothetical protein
VDYPLEVYIDKIIKAGAGEIFLNNVDKDGQMTPGPEVLNLQRPDKLSAEIATVAKYLPDLRAMALQPDAPETFKYFVRVIESAAPQEQA